MSEEKVEKGLTLQTIKDNIAVWAVCAIVGLANYQLAKLNDTVGDMKDALTKLGTISDHHKYRLDQQLERIKACEEKNTSQDVELGKLQVRFENGR